MWLSTNVDDLFLLCCCGGLTVYTESWHFTRIVSFYPAAAAASSTDPASCNHEPFVPAMRELMGVDGCCLWLSTNVDDLCLLCCCGGLTVYTESGHFSRIVSFYPSREKVSSNIPSKRANKLALRVVSHGTQTLSLPPKWQHIHMGAFSYPDERFLL